MPERIETSKLFALQCESCRNKMQSGLTPVAVGLCRKERTILRATMKEKMAEFERATDPMHIAEAAQKQLFAAAQENAGAFWTFQGHRCSCPAGSALHHVPLQCWHTVPA